MRAHTVCWAQVQLGALLPHSALTCGLCFSRLRELEKQRESTATDILQKKQEAEAAVSARRCAPPGSPFPA